ncbi:MAG: hypothetical protein ACI81L_000022 [Verrucomicrobiales bacterium]
MLLLSRRAAVSVAPIAALAASVVVIPIGQVRAQDDAQEIEELKEERERVAKEAAIAVGDIDVVTATVEDVTKALDALAVFVDLQRIRLDEATSFYDAALDAIGAARLSRQTVLSEADIVRVHLTNLAVSSFTGESGTSGEDLTNLMLSDDPGLSARFIHLLELQTGSLSDGIDHLRLLEVEADLLIVEEASAVERSAAGLALVDRRTKELEEALQLQGRVVTAAEIRLESKIAEAAILQDRDVELATKIRDKQTAINQRVATSARTNGVQIPTPVDLDDIVRLDFYVPGQLPEAKVDPDTGEELPVIIPLEVEPFLQIEVHRDIEEQTRSLFEKAFASGIELAGWGYRPIQLQIELRAAHCGGSDFDIWHRPVFECAPPTARPGFSKHEQGRAIDFTFRGQSIQSKENPAFAWLQQNAPAYGFENLESEPWHWSISKGKEKAPAN